MTLDSMRHHASTGYELEYPHAKTGVSGYFYGGFRQALLLAWVLP